MLHYYSKVWPHHFDEGILTNIKREKDSVKSLISMGLAISDNYYDQPYFYVNAWKESGVDYKKLPLLTSKGEWYQHEWTGQVLKADHFASLIRHEDQEKEVADFLEEAIKNAISLL